MKRFPIADFRLWIGAPAIFIVALALALLAAPLAVGAQQAGKVYRIAYVTFPASPAPFILTGLQAFRHALRDLGWIEGQNVGVEMRTAESDEKLPEVFAQIVREKFDLLVTANTPAALAAKEATRPSRSSWPLPATRSSAAWWAASRTPAATSPGSRSSTRRSPESGSSSSRR